MSTLLTALFYLWLVLTILLVIMWLIRGRGHGPDDSTGATDETDETDSQDADSDEDDNSEDEDADIDDSVEDDVDDLVTEDSVEDDLGASADRLAVPSQPTVEDLLEGVTLPYDLSPISGRIEDPGRHAVFLSPHDDAEEVGTAFADELVRLGFDIEPGGFDEALAKRNGDMLSLRISPKAAEVRTGGTPRYPSANPSDVAIEVWTGQGPPPSLAD